MNTVFSFGQNKGNPMKRNNIYKVSLAFLSSMVVFQSSSAQEQILLDRGSSGHSLIEHKSARLGGADSGGGDAVVCFLDDPKAEDFFTSEGVLTREGRERVSKNSAVVYSRDYYRVKDHRDAMTTYQDYKGTYKILVEMVSGVPRFKQDVTRYFNKMKWIDEEGIPQSSGLKNLDDAGGFTNFPKNCHPAQAVVRTGTSYEYDPLLWRHMDDMNQAVLQFHEVIYYLAQKEYKHKDSYSTSLLIGYLLTAKEIQNGDWGSHYHRAGELSRKMESLKFSDYADVSTNYGYRKTLRILIESAIRSLGWNEAPEVTPLADYLTAKPSAVAYQLESLTRRAQIYTDLTGSSRTENQAGITQLRKILRELDQFEIDGFSDPY